LLATGTVLPAAELLHNGGFEKPLVDGLTQAYPVDQQVIPGWQFSGGTVQILNHTRLLPGEGFQSLLLPCTATASASIRQEFNVDTAGPLRISFHLAASKAVAGEIAILLDGHALSEFWQPDEIALTDQMQWRSVSLPSFQASAGPHTLAFQVLKFQPRSDRQGDTREIVQGILLDAVTVQSLPFTPPGSAEKRAWPVEPAVGYPPTGILPLDAIAGPWVATRTLACYPSLANFYGALRSTKELGGLQYVHFVDVGGVDAVLNSVSVDGQPVFCDDSRWYPYQLCTRAQTGPLNLASTIRMTFAGHGVLSLLTITNPSDQNVVRTFAINLGTHQVIHCPDAHTVVIADSTPRACYFPLAPDGVVATNGEIRAQWQLSLPPHAGLAIPLALALAKTSAAAVMTARQCGQDFPTAFAAAQTGWEQRWQAVFTPGNGIYSGNLPTLETDDPALRRLYYLSVASLLATERDNFSQFKQCFVGEDPEWGGEVTWFWDYSLTSLPYALLNPAVMKNEMRHWLTIDWRTCSHFSLYTGKPDGSWYAVNPYAYFLSLDRYLTVTRDFAFLSESIHGITVLGYLEMLATDWQRLVPPGGRLADIGGNSWNMLEAPPNYVHTVASLNAANIWMLRTLAGYQARAGHLQRAAELRAQANALVPELLKLYNPQTGSWNVLYPDGRQIDSRHVYDYLTVGTTISEDLSPVIKSGMLNFVGRELLTKTWLRAMSRQDPSAFDSDRSDHGPAGSYTGWAAKTAQATAEMGRFDQALAMFHQFNGAFSAAIPQAMELTKVAGQPDLQARVSTRAGASFAEVSGSFAEVIINTFFGYRPDLAGKTALWQPAQVRGFTGQLRHLRWHGGLYTIVSDHHGLHLEKE